MTTNCSVFKTQHTAASKQRYQSHKLTYEEYPRSVTFFLKSTTSCCKFWLRPVFGQYQSLKSASILKMGNLGVYLHTWGWQWIAGTLIHVLLGVWQWRQIPVFWLIWIYDGHFETWTGQQGIIFSGSASFVWHMFARLSSIAGICPLEGTWCAAAVIPTFTNMSSHKYTATCDPMSIRSDVIDLNGANIYIMKKREWASMWSFSYQGH